MTRVGSEYAQALYSLAKDEGLSERLLDETRLLRQVLSENPDYLKVLSAPNLSKQERCAALDECLRGRVHPYLLNFAKILTEKGYARHMIECCDAYEALYNEDCGILTVTAVTAVPLTGEQSERLCAKLQQMTGKRISMSNSVDPACLGGVRLDYDGKRVDDTVRHRLDALASLLHNTML